MKKSSTSRREFLKTAVVSGAALGVGGPAFAQSEEKAPAAAAAKVPRKQLGATGEDVPILLLGCAQRFDPVYDRMRALSISTPPSATPRASHT